MEIIDKIPCWYAAIALIWSIYQGYRGVLEQRLYHNAKVYIPANKEWMVQRNPEWSCREQCIVLYIHDFVFRFVCTMAGFATLFFTYYILSNTTDLINISAGTSALVASAFIIGVIGVGGQLHHVILLGKTK